ncbi:MAG: aminopeptidase P family protein [Anaerotruncus sp.]|nr:aminopeptidase P family protein [Anaerotruncus sp.]
MEKKIKSAPRLALRIEELCRRLPEDVDGILITSEVNRLYFTGLQSSAGTLLVLKNAGGFFIIDSRYIEKARAVVQNCEVLLQKPCKLFAQLAGLFAQHQVRRLAVEGEYMSISTFREYKRQLSEFAQLVSLPPVNRLLREMRGLKSTEEIRLIERSQEITDRAFTHICGYIREGMTEREIAGELLDFTYRQGSERPAFDFIVVSGENSSMPHGVPTERKVRQGDFITMDFGCVVGGYCSDMTRTVAIGAVTEEQQRVYDTVLAAQEAAIRMVRAGVLCQQVDQAARDLIDAAGYQGCFGHGTGHSLGVEIHEPPAFNTVDKTPCLPGMVITVEPGIYLEGRFGVRIEDMVCVTKEGSINLTRSEKKLLLL